MFSLFRFLIPSSGFEHCAPDVHLHPGLAVCPVRPLHPAGLRLHRLHLRIPSQESVPDHSLRTHGKTFDLKVRSDIAHLSFFLVARTPLLHRPDVWQRDAVLFLVLHLRRLCVHRDPDPEVCAESDPQGCPRHHPRPAPPRHDVRAQGGHFKGAQNQG